MTLEYNNILAAVDGSHEAELAFKKSIELAKRHNAVLHLLHVVDTRAYTTMTKHVPGSPKKVISRDYANRLDADLIVCGAQGLNAFEHYLMGSVSQHIVSSSPCDVLVVRGNKRS